MPSKKPGTISRTARHLPAAHLKPFSTSVSGRSRPCVRAQQRFPKSPLATAISLDVRRLSLGGVFALAATLTSAPLLAQSFPSQIDLSDLDGSNGFVINGVKAFDRADTSVSSAGDFNGDGFADIIIGADGVDPGGKTKAGAGYVVFGAATLGNSGELNLSSLDGETGFVMDGLDSEFRTGNQVSHAGDFNGDGVSDVIIGAPSARGLSENYAGF